MWKHIHAFTVALTTITALVVVQLAVYTPTNAAIRRRTGGTIPSAIQRLRGVPAVNESPIVNTTPPATPEPAPLPAAEVVPTPTSTAAPTRVPSAEMLDAARSLRARRSPATNSSAAQREQRLRAILPTVTRETEAFTPPPQTVPEAVPAAVETAPPQESVASPDAEATPAPTPDPVIPPPVVTDVPAVPVAPIEPRVDGEGVAPDPIPPPLPPPEPTPVRDIRAPASPMTMPRRRPLPERLNSVLAPVNTEPVTSALQVTLSDTDRQQATKLRERVVPSAMFEAAPETTRAAVETFIAVGPGGVTGIDPCVQVGAGQRAALIEAFRMTQHRLPESTEDYQFACALVTDPEHPIDVTKEFGDTHRNTEQETYALKNFVNFFGRPPSKAVSGDALAPEVADRDWWAVKYLTYHPVLAATVRNRDGERDCIRAFVDSEVDLYEQQDDGGFVKVKKVKGAAPTSLWQWDFIRACTYSGAPFVEEFTSRARKPQPPASTQRRLLH